ncbi:MAG: DUF3795 domain-containing protein [Candidatus Bathyarchaeota archaeon]|nr:DUF3795 domain-containing protein [Candidatus Bathyarchaeota archaeon]
MSENLVTPCGSYCGTCEFLNRKEKPSCSGCSSQAGHPFWGDCKLFACVEEKGVDHCGSCRDFPCELFVNQFDPAHGRKSAFTRAGLLAYRKKAGTDKFIEIIKKVEEEEKSSQD